MNPVEKAIRKLAEESNGAIRIVKVPRPTAEDLRKLENEIRAGIEANEAMLIRSYIYASKKV